jgi:hypothetical protein
MNIQLVFGCGIDGQTLKARYEGLSEENKLRLGRVAGRVWLTLKLRYEMAFYNNPFAWRGEEYNLKHVELPSIEVLCTCLDTLAGKPVHKNFKDWIRGQPNVTGLGLEEITHLYAQYEEEYGVGRNLRALFKNLPRSVKNWLASNVVIRRSDQPLSVKEQDPDKLVNRLYVYFYNVRRNAFTHGSVSRPTPIAGDVREPKDGEWWITPASGTHFVLYRDRPNQEWNLSYRQGLDEATILRMIIHAAGLQMLGIEPTRELIDTNLRNYSRLDALYAFVSEVNRNSAAVSWWSKLDDPSMTDFRLFLIHEGISPLGSESSTVMADRYLDNPLESGLRQMTLQYLGEVNHINSAVTDFNESNPPSRDSHSLNERWQVIKEFLDGLVKTPFYNLVLKWPSIKEMTNLWLVIRDPCYTPNTI